MKIANSRQHSAGGFALDSKAIKLTTINTGDILLPYTGDLPDKISADGACIAFHMMPTQARVVLVCRSASAGKDRRFPLDYTATEVKTLLDKFFFKDGGGTRQDTGLDQYSLGLWMAHYIDWMRTEAV